MGASLRTSLKLPNQTLRRGRGWLMAFLNFWTIDLIKAVNTWAFGNVFIRIFKSKLTTRWAVIVGQKESWKRNLKQQTQQSEAVSNIYGLRIRAAPRSHSTVITVICPPLIFTVNMPTLFLRAVFSKFFGRRCLVEGLVSAPAHPLPPPKNVSTPGLKKWQDSQIHILP